MGTYPSTLLGKRSAKGIINTDVARAMMDMYRMTSEYCMPELANYHFCFKYRLNNYEYSLK